MEPSAHDSRVWVHTQLIILHQLPSTGPFAHQAKSPPSPAVLLTTTMSSRSYPAHYTPPAPFLRAAPSSLYFANSFKAVSSSLYSASSLPQGCSYTITSRPSHHHHHPIPLAEDVIKPGIPYQQTVPSFPLPPTSLGHPITPLTNLTPITQVAASTCNVQLLLSAIIGHSLQL